MSPDILSFLLQLHDVYGLHLLNSFDVSAPAWTTIGAKFDYSHQRCFELFRNQSLIDCLLIGIVLFNSDDVSGENLLQLLINLI